MNRPFSLTLIAASLSVSGCQPNGYSSSDIAFDDYPNYVEARAGADAVDCGTEELNELITTGIEEKACLVSAFDGSYAAFALFHSDNGPTGAISITDDGRVFRSTYEGSRSPSGEGTAVSIECMEPVFIGTLETAHGALFYCTGEVQ